MKETSVYKTDEAYINVWVFPYMLHILSSSSYARAKILIDFGTVIDIATDAVIYLLRTNTSTHTNIFFFGQNGLYLRTRFAH